MLSPMDSLALLISPLGFWNLFTLRLRHVHKEGEEFAGGDFIDKTTGIDDKELKRLVELCLWTQSDNLFAKSGRNFSNKKAHHRSSSHCLTAWCAHILRPQAG